MARRQLGQPPPSCIVPRHPKLGNRRVFNVSDGAEALAYLRARTRRDPLWGFLSGVMHAGQIGYNVQQKVVEAMVADDRGLVIEAIRSNQVQKLLWKKYALRGINVEYGPQKAAALPYAMDCWEKLCVSGDSPNGEACVTTNGKLSARATLLTRCLVRRVPHGTGQGMGSKAINMLAEYLGCDQAVAVDRHVANWLSNAAGVLAWAQNVRFKRSSLRAPCPGTFFKPGMWGKQPVCSYYGRVVFVKSEEESNKLREAGIPAVAGVSDQMFPMMKRQVHNLARRCGVPPATYQVAAWLQGACDSTEGDMKGKVYLGAGRTYDCANVPRVDLGPPPNAWALSSLAPEWRRRAFRCRTDYFQGTDDTGQLIRLWTRPPAHVPFVRYEYGPIFPVVPEERFARRAAPPLPPAFAPRPAPRLQPAMVMGRLARRLIDGARKRA